MFEIPSMRKSCGAIYTVLLLVGALLAGSALRADENPPAPPPAETKPEAANAPAGSEKAVTPAATDAEKTAATPTAAKSDATTDNSALVTATPAAPDAPEAATTDKPAVVTPPVVKPDSASSDDDDDEVKGPGITVSTGHGRDRVRFFEDVFVPTGSTVPGDAVAIMAGVNIAGEVMQNAVAVMGEATVNGHVHHDVVAIMGDVNLGPGAIVDGNAVSVGGEVHRDPTAKVSGKVQMKPIGELKRLGGIWDRTLKIGRPLAIGAHLAWLWIVTAFSVAIYALLALIFPGTIRRCGDRLVQEPGMTVLAAVLSLIALPVLFILLCITVVGIPIALLLLPVTLVICVLFGKAAIYGLVGRRVTNDRVPLALATILGAAIFVLLYLLPLFGLLLFVLVSLVGFGTVVLTIFSSRDKPAKVPAGSGAKPVAAMPAAMAPVAGVTVAASEPPVVSAPVAEPQPASFEVPAPTPAPAPAPIPAAPLVVPPALPPLVDAMSLPRVGFWLRLAAAALDFIMVAIVVSILAHTMMDRFGPGPLFFSLAAYSAAMWKARGTTVGGIICGIKVVRLDGRPIDWPIACVRAMAGFLSFFAAGLGFIWVAFDPEKQSWHDKVAGTTIVRVPRGTSLL